MADIFNVTFAWSQTTAYATGSTITGSITGGDVLTTTTTTNQPVGPLTVTITAADGATETITAPTATRAAATTVSTPQSVKITKVVDNNANPLTWTIASNGLSISAVAP